MSSINKLQSEIIKALDVFDSVKTEIYAGQFDSLGARNSLITAPSILVSMMDAKVLLDSGTEEIDIDCQWSAFCVMRHVNDVKNRHVTAHDLAEQVALKIAFNRFGILSASTPENISIKPINSRFFIENGLSVLAVIWKQSARVGDSVWDSGGTLPEEILIGLAPETGQGNEGFYDAL
jgi:hypothetical protein